MFMNDDSALGFFSQMLNWLENDYLTSFPEFKRMFSLLVQEEKTGLSFNNF